MRFFIKCDICNKEVLINPPRIPKDFSLIDGLDMCKSCQMLYKKRIREVIQKLQKERFK
jgi:hypothetical protein